MSIHWLQQLNLIVAFLIRICIQKSNHIITFIKLQKQTHFENKYKLFGIHLQKKRRKIWDRHSFKEWVKIEFHYPFQDHLKNELISNGIELKIVYCICFLSIFIKLVNGIKQWCQRMKLNQVKFIEQIDFYLQQMYKWNKSNKENIGKETESANCWICCWQWYETTCMECGRNHSG